MQISQYRTAAREAGQTIESHPQGRIEVDRRERKYVEGLERSEEQHPLPHHSHQTGEQSLLGYPAGCLYQIRLDLSLINWNYRVKGLDPADCRMQSNFLDSNL